MMGQQNLRKINALRMLVLGSSIAWGVIEFLALQRSRYYAWLTRS
ncbi:hypothetical protein [Polaromonas sp.]|nr:hypothetical protein [Polaromonas sp.]